MNPLQGLIDLISGFTRGPTFSYDFSDKKKQPQNLQQALMSPAPTPISTPTPSNNLNQNQVKAGIGNKWGTDNPILSNLDVYLQAGQQLNQQFGIDPLLPVILALRETQGGKDLTNPAKNAKLGKNNVFNIRNNTGAFQDYPDLNTAVMGNLSQGGESGGLVGLLGGTKPSSHGIYENFRQNPQDLTQLFSHWSPPQDNNGALDEQVQNYNWIRNAILGGG